MSEALSNSYQEASPMSAEDLEKKEINEEIEAAEEIVEETHKKFGIDTPPGKDKNPLDRYTIDALIENDKTNEIPRLLYELDDGVREIVSELLHEGKQLLPRHKEVLTEMLRAYRKWKRVKEQEKSR